MRIRAIKKAKCSKCYWWTWYTTAGVYVLAIIFLGIGAGYFANLPGTAVKVVNKQASTVNDVLNKTVNVADSLFTSVLSIQQQPFKQFMYGSTADLNNSLDAIKQQLNTSQLVNDAWNKIDQF